MSFYHPLTLGIPHSAPPQEREDARGSRYRDSYREGGHRFDFEYEEHPESSVLATLRATGHGMADRFWLVLGEPGAGKSTLMREWFRRWAGELRSPSLGMAVPVLVRLRELRSGAAEHGGEELADLLWKSRARPGGAIEQIYGHADGRGFRPVWLLDGLDEVTPELLDAAFIEKLVSLPGPKVLSCRTAVYESLRRNSGWYPSPEREYEVLGLKPAEQVAFLTRAFGGAEARAKTLHAALRRNAQVGVLASNPLMLSLIAEVSGSMSLPRSRAAFYQEAVRKMWQVKLGQDPGSLWLSTTRDEALTALAARMGLGMFEAPVSLVMEVASRIGAARADALAGCLVRSGVLRLESHREVCGFVHRTFQEYYLARSLEHGGLAAALECHWRNDAYEETLALLTSLLLEQDRHEEVEQAVRWLVTWGETTHREDPGVLRASKRSPLEVALHVLGRTGAGLDTRETRLLFDFLWERAAFSVRRKERLARDPRIPTGLLARLAADDDFYVRMHVADNPSTPGEVLARLAVDEDSTVRISVARNPSTPAEVLAWLAVDENSTVRTSVARNPSTPAEVLVRWLVDDWYVIRLDAIKNPSMPVEVLARSGADGDEQIRQSVASNPGTPVEVLARLVADEDLAVRRSLARSRGVPAEVLARLAADEHRFVRGDVGGNPDTPAGVLARLADDEDEIVRRDVAGNRSTPAEVLARLAADRDEDVRRSVAGNRSTPAEVLARLAADQDEGVRRAVADNRSTPSEVLARLAVVEDASVCRLVAGNRSTPAEVLARLAADQDEGVRRAVADNRSTPSEVLARLAAAEDALVRMSVAGNPSTPAEILAQLTADENENVVLYVHFNGGLLLEDV